MTEHLFILTGASRGMGLALAQQLRRAGHSLLCISRHVNDTLSADAGHTAGQLEQWPMDLTDSQPAVTRLQQWLNQASGRYASATLINNAGVIPRIVPLAQAAADDLAGALRINLEAPMLLSAAFLGATEQWAVPRRILNISSGLGRRPMASQSAYCASKAGLDHFTRCLALEEARKPHGAKVCSLAPGVIDTDMQVQLRSADAADFPDQGNFAQLKHGGLLTSPEAAATRVLAYLARPDFGTEPVADVRG